MRSILINHKIGLKWLRKYILFILILFAVDYSISYFLTEGLKKYYGFNTQPEILLIGHSHTMLGLNKNMIEAGLHCKVAKYAIEGVNVLDRLTMVNHFLHQKGNSVKIITYDVDAFFLTRGGLSKNSYQLFYPFMDDKYINEYIKLENKNKYEYLVKKFIKTSRFTDLNLNGSLRGYLRFYSNIKIGVIDTVAYKKKIENNDFAKITFDSDLQAKFEETLKIIQNAHITLVLVLIPTIDILNRMEPEKYEKAISLLEEYSRNNKNVYFINYNVEYANQHELFYDPIHLNPKGSKVITERLIKDLRKIFVISKE